MKTRLVVSYMAIGLVMGCASRGPAPSEHMMSEKIQRSPLGTLWNFNDPQGSEKAFRGAMAAGAEAGDLAYTLEAQTQLARALGLQQKFDAAQSELEQVLEQGRALSDAPAVMVRYHLESGRVLNSQGDKSGALPHFMEAYTLGQAAQLDGLTVDAVHMVAIALSGEAALQWNEKALALAESSEQPAAQKWKGSLYNNLGWTYFDLGRYAEALDIFKRAQVLREESGKPGPILIAKWCVARTLRAMGDVDEALKLQRELLAAHEAAGTEDGYVFEELGECLLAQGDGPEAQPYFEKAYELLSQDGWMMKNEADRMARLKTLAEGGTP